MEVKEQYVDQFAKGEKTKEQVRFFYKGRELQDDLFVYSYEMVDDTVMSVMFRK